MKDIKGGGLKNAYYTHQVKFPIIPLSLSPPLLVGVGPGVRWEVRGEGADFTTTYASPIKGEEGGGLCNP
jgi:hypothetical protein